MRRPRLVVIQGTLELLILKTLAATGGMHGFGILEFIRKATDEALVIEEGALYPALHRMEAKGWIQSRPGVAESGRRVRTYRLTPGGTGVLRTESERWEAYVAAVEGIGAGSAVAHG